MLDSVKDKIQTHGRSVGMFAIGVKLGAVVSFCIGLGLDICVQ
jgi:hypothetical protein